MANSMRAGKKTRGKTERVSDSLKRLMRGVLGRRGFARAEIVTRWPEIVGPGFAAQTMPERISYARGHEMEPGTLTVRVCGPIGLELQHLAPIVIDRINTYYGFRAVDRLKLVQGPLPEPRGRTFIKPRPLTPDEEAELQAQLGRVRDPRLRAALAELGRDVIGNA